MKKNWNAKITKAISDKRLLIISPFDESITRVTEKTSQQRNRYMIDLADEVFIPYAQPSGLIFTLIDEIIQKNKQIKMLDIKENQSFTEKGKVILI